MRSELVSGAAHEVGADALAMVLDTAELGVVVLDPGCLVRYANAAATRLLGTEAGDLVGTTFGWEIDPDRPVIVETGASRGAATHVEVTTSRSGADTGAAGEGLWLVTLREVEPPEAAAPVDDHRSAALDLTVHELSVPMDSLVAATTIVSQRWEELPSIRRLDLLRKVNASAREIWNAASRLSQVLESGADPCAPEPQQCPLAEVVEETLFELGEAARDATVRWVDDAVVLVHPDHLRTIVRAIILSCARESTAVTPLLGAVPSGPPDDARPGWATLTVTGSAPWPAIGPNRRQVTGRAIIDSDHTDHALSIALRLAQRYGGEVTSSWGAGEQRVTCRLPAVPRTGGGILGAPAEGIGPQARAV